MVRERIDPSHCDRYTWMLAKIIQDLCLIHGSTILDVFRDLFKQARLHVLIKSAMLSVSFPDCTNVCQGMPNFFPLQVEDSSNDPGEHSFVEFVHRGHASRGYLVYPKLCVRKCLVKS
jgi:hypothetical protein